MRKQTVLVMFGGVSPEHEVSIITGLQVLEKIDRTKFDVHALYQDMDRIYMIYPNLTSRKQFSTSKGRIVSFGRDNKGAFVETLGIIKQRFYVDIAYLAFHGGNGEGGQIQGMLEGLGIPFTSSAHEGAAIAQNKILTKELLLAHDLPSVKGISFTSTEVKTDNKKAVDKVKQTLGLPVIVKPAHLGSSIGIKVAHTEAELGKALMETSFIDIEILVEQLLTNFVEYNCSVRTVNNKVEVSEIEKPLRKDEILSFADKYQRGQKKTGSTSGMASLSRELPAKISPEFRDELQQLAVKTYTVCRCGGVVRIDFMVTADQLVYITEINTIPGSMAFYLWEASGVPFTEQITQSLEQAVRDHKTRVEKRLKYKTDIVEKFVNN